MGSTDLGAGFADGALVFSDGTNSGIKVTALAEDATSATIKVEFASYPDSGSDDADPTNPGGSGSGDTDPTNPGGSGNSGDSNGSGDSGNSGQPSTPAVTGVPMYRLYNPNSVSAQSDTR